MLKSALGNAEDRGARDIDDLVVTEARIDGGPIMKRIMPRARGTAYPIQRRICHIHVAIATEPEEITAAGRRWPPRRRSRPRTLPQSPPAVQS